MDVLANAPEQLLARITAIEGVCGGRACIRDLRIRVTDVLEMKALGVPDADILADFPDLEPGDLTACLHYAARQALIPVARG